MDHYPSWPAPSVRRLLRKGSCLSRHGRGLPFPDLLSGAKNAGSRHCSAVIRDEWDKIDFLKLFFTPLVPVKENVALGLWGKQGRRRLSRSEAAPPCWLTAAVITRIRDPHSGMERSVGRCRTLENPGCSWGATLLRAVAAECLSRARGAAGAAGAGGGFGSARTLPVLWSPCEPFPASVLSFQGLFLCNLFFRLLPQRRAPTALHSHVPALSGSAWVPHSSFPSQEE